MQPSVPGLTERREATSVGGVNRTPTWLVSWEGRFAAQNALPHSGLASQSYFGERPGGRTPQDLSSTWSHSCQPLASVPIYIKTNLCTVKCR